MIKATKYFLEDNKRYLILLTGKRRGRWEELDVSIKNPRPRKRVDLYYTGRIWFNSDGRVYFNLSTIANLEAHCIISSVIDLLYREGVRNFRICKQDSYAYAELDIKKRGLSQHLESQHYNKYKYSPPQRLSPAEIVAQ